MISTADLQDWMKANDDDVSVLRVLEEAAIAAAQKETGHYYGVTATLTEIIRFRGWPLQLKNDPIGGVITSLEQWDGSAWGVVATSDYYVDGSFIWPEGSFAWPNSFRLPSGSLRFRAIYQGGYTVDPLDADVWSVDADVRQAILLTVGNWFENRESVVVGTSAAELPQSAKDLLNNNRRVTV